MLVTRNVVTREEVIATIRELAAKLDRRPARTELCSALNLTTRCLENLFGNYANALKASGLDPFHSGRLTTEELLDDWRAMVRKLGKVPTIYEYRRESRYSERPLRQRFGTWNDVPAGLLKFGDRKQLWAGWEDVRELVEAHVDERTTSTSPPRLASTLGPVDVQLTYGEPLTDSPMPVAPTNELGVVLLFGGMARRLGFAVLKLFPKDFPDCEALREVAPNCWQKLRIEFEFESRNFLSHGHDPRECDLIVCWKHNWEGCLVEVLELRSQIAGIARDRT